MELDCGIAETRILAWLDGEICLARDGETWVYHCDDGACRVSLSPLENRVLGKLNLQRTLVSVDGDDEAVEQFMHLFTLRFMSAGG